MRLNDAVFGLFFIALGLTMILIARGFPAFPGQPYGAALLPSLLGAGFIICGGLLSIRGWRARAGGLAETDPEMREPRTLVSMGLVVVLILAYILVSDAVGYVPFMAVALTLLLLRFGNRPLTAIAVALLTTVASQWFFGSILLVPLPRGILEGLF
ncbi:tripartite tricarboxylate transporter TctB family protein [Oceanicella sp. SM1341]|uniref:tripartite tricarboxylate transporter TctB family protein n=1 Tax=Oceanicella sp. SM1341 TaxID=1548889 RepID=UPI000E4EDFE5|nr:tripartite tricarboxylate transporter TctB family protein [Oceanicella sp. SM1341]